MKRIFYLFIGLSLLLLSCESNPEAHFYSDTIEPSVGQEVFFTNNSRNANRYEWDFGDGYISNDENPTHIFTGTGTYEVTLAAISKSGLEDNATLTIEVLIPTLLVIEVREWDNVDVFVPDASIILYNSLDDWDANDPDRMVMEGFTDNNGVAVFANLDPYVYYADVYEETHDNWDFRTPIDNILYIRTPEVMSHQINWFIAWVDVVDHGKSQVRGSRPLAIRKIERKSSYNEKPTRGGTENWQDLYNRRSNR